MGRKTEGTEATNWKPFSINMDADQFDVLSTLASLQGTKVHQLLKEIISEGLERRADLVDEMRKAKMAAALPPKKDG